MKLRRALVLGSILLAAVVMILNFTGSGPPSAVNALVRPGAGGQAGVFGTNPPLAPGTVVDINVGQMLSYANVSVTLLSIQPNKPPAGLKMVGSFIALLCGPGDSGDSGDPPTRPFAFEQSIQGARTWYPLIESPRPMEVLSVPADVKLSKEKTRPGGPHCQFLPDWIWNIRVTAMHEGRYAWTGLLATYRADGETYSEVIPDNGYVLTYK